jgi:hypothetical protein
MRRFLRISEEAAFAVFPTSSPVQFYLRLDQGDSFSVMHKPEFWQIMSGSGFAVPALFGSQVSPLGMTLSIPLDYGNAAALLGWACQIINTGQTLPWTTTEIAGDLASATVEEAWSNFDGTIRRKRNLGCKVGSLSISCSRDSPVARLNMGIIGSTPQGNAYDGSTDPSAANFPAPADSVFLDNPVLFQHLKSGLTIGNTARSNFQSINFTVQNRIKPYFDEDRFANLIRFNGRTTTLSGVSRLKATPDDRTSYESAATIGSANTLAFVNGSHSVTFTLNAQNYFSQIGEQFTLDEEIYYAWTLSNLLDTAATTDFTFAVT